MSATTREVPAPHLPVAELALVGVTVAAVFSFSRLFADWSFFWPLMAVVVYAHGITMILRRREVGIATSAVVSTIGFVFLASWLWFASSTFYGVPDASTWDAFTTSLYDSWSAFQELTAPVPVQSGFLIAAAAAVFFAVFLADWAAFRLWSPIESIIPALTLFVFSTLLGAEQQRMTSAFVFCAACLVYLLAHRVARLETSSGWLTADIARGSRWLLRAGIALAAVAVIGGVVIGPRLPTANDDAIVDLREGDGDGPSSRVTVSPLVDIRGRLVEQSDIEVFTVRSPEPAYWRLTALDTFDGQIWRSGGRYGEADGDLGADVPNGVATKPLDQEFTIERLSALWLPAAFQPVSIDPEGAAPRYERVSSTLIVDTTYQSSDQLTYQVTSQLPTPDAAQLQVADQTAPESMAVFTELPSDFSPRATALASEIVTTAGAVEPYDQALALQDHFRQWTYDLDPGIDGHGNAAIDEFLDQQAGYCEMFAGTYAAMARSLGIPARVAVGFTWGDNPDPDDPTLYSVKGRHAHAWPEVWLGDDVGWIAFEPTPGRGAPTMASYNSVEPAQAGETGESSSTSLVTSTTATPSSTTTTTPLGADELEAQLGTTDGSSDSTSDDGPPFVVKLGIAALVVLAGVIVYALAAYVATGLRRRRRRDQAVEPGERVALAWDESLEELELIDVVRRPSETHTEFAHRAGRTLPDHDRDLDDLATLADAVTYAPDALDEASASRADSAASAISTVVRERVPRHRVWLRRVDPRRLRRPPTGRPRQQARSSAR
jgi:transglutaminase-like putative cysteine protease